MFWSERRCYIAEADVGRRLAAVARQRRRELLPAQLPSLLWALSKLGLGAEQQAELCVGMADVAATAVRR